MVSPLPDVLELLLHVGFPSILRALTDTTSTHQAVSHAQRITHIDLPEIHSNVNESQRQGMLLNLPFTI